MVSKTNDNIQLHHPQTTILKYVNDEAKERSTISRLYLAVSSLFQSVPKFVYFHRKEFRRKASIFLALI